jgi:glucan phosphoethanolaminetransferase (alkaline phosphatase superfamily)
MDYIHFHLILTHYPIVGTLLTSGLLLYGLLTKNMLVKKIAYVLFFILSLITLPTYFSGGEAEDLVEKLPGISENLIEEHEEWAESALWFMSVLGLLSAFAWIVASLKKPRLKWIHPVVFIFSLITFGVFVKVGNLGGQIRHTEIRSGMEQSVPTQQSDQIYKYEEEDDDDD